jgi:hypothetical protein
MGYDTGFSVWDSKSELRFGDLATKSPRWFLGLGLKTKWTMVCRLRYKTNGRTKMARDTHRDLAACISWKRVELGFHSLASRLAEARCGWCTWHHRGGHVEVKSKTDGLTQWAASDSSNQTLSFLLY